MPFPGARFALSASLLLAAAAGASAAARPGHPAAPAGSACASAACHGRLLAAGGGPTGGSSHTPAADGDCSACHDLALSAAARFVKGAPANPGAEPERARAWDLELCTRCHDAVLSPPGAAGASGFADGRRNLHALHVQAGRGRRCLPCHDPHAARQPRLLRERIPARGNAQIPQEFRGRPNGGWCRTGCHAPKSYQR